LKVGQVTESTHQPREEKISISQLLEEVRTLRARKDWLGAVQTYQNLIRMHPSSPEAHTCLVPMGQLQLYYLKQPKAALQAFRQYLTVAPRGSLAEEAAWGEVLALRQMNQIEEEGKACRRFLDHFPQSLYAAKARQCINSLINKEK